MTAKNLPDLAGALSRVQKPTAPHQKQRLPRRRDPASRP